MLGTKALQIFDETTSRRAHHAALDRVLQARVLRQVHPLPRGHLVAGADADEVRGRHGRSEGDVDKLLDICDNIGGRSFCALADGAVACVTSAVKHFRAEFELGYHTPAWELFPYEKSALFAVEKETTHERRPQDDDRRGVAPKPDLVTLTIDGTRSSVPKGTLIIRAAEMIGIAIPRFCDHPLLDPVGACRQCMVDIPDAGNGRGFPKPQASCTMPVAEGMKVNTQVTSPVAEKAQQGMLELLLINHPLDCPICDKGGECPLQNQALSQRRAARAAFRELKRTFPKPVSISAQILLDRERCVLCARCTRFSEQISGDPFIALVERGALQQIGTYEQDPYDSYFSGNVVQICPVGALTSAAYRFQARPFDLVSTTTTCEHCAAGCELRADHRHHQVKRRLAGTTRGQRGVELRQGPLRLHVRPRR